MKIIFEKSSGNDGINLTDEEIKLDFLPQEFLRENKIISNKIYV